MCAKCGNSEQNIINSLKILYKRQRQNFQKLKYWVSKNSKLNIFLLKNTLSKLYFSKTFFFWKFSTEITHSKCVHNVGIPSRIKSIFSISYSLLLKLCHCLEQILRFAFYVCFVIEVKHILCCTMSLILFFMNFFQKNTTSEEASTDKRSRYERIEFELVHIAEGDFGSQRVNEN